MKIYKVRGCKELADYEIADLKERLDAEVFIYNYEYEAWEGTGFALWKKGNKYGYAYLGHCSCNGPLEDLQFGKQIMLTWKQLRDLEKKRDYEWSDAAPVIKRMEKYLADTNND